MTTIRNRTLLMPGQIQQAVQIVFDGSPQEVQAFAPDLIECVNPRSSTPCMRTEPPPQGHPGQREHLRGRREEGRSRV
jgi:hypothetical protein